MKAIKQFFPFLAVVFSLGLGGCATTLTNLTPLNIPENPSGIYTFSVSAKIRQTNADRETIKTTIVINGEEHKMELSDIGSDIYDFDYKMPRDLNEYVL